MVIVLIGYMASGKSTVGKLLASKIGYDFIDLDDYIEQKESSSVSEIFKKKGELYFRKVEALCLSELLNADFNTILSLGGGTPCYRDNMKLILESNNVTSIYLKASVDSLANRLEGEKQKRPLVAHIGDRTALIEFLGKHLFERGQFYSQAGITIDTNDKTELEIVEKIVLQLF